MIHNPIIALIKTVTNKSLSSFKTPTTTTNNIPISSNKQTETLIQTTSITNRVNIIANRISHNRCSFLNRTHILELAIVVILNSLLMSLITAESTTQIVSKITGLFKALQAKVKCKPKISSSNNFQKTKQMICIRTVLISSNANEPSSLINS